MTRQINHPWHSGRGTALAGRSHTTLDRAEHANGFNARLDDLLRQHLRVRSRPIADVGGQLAFGRGVRDQPAALLRDGHDWRTERDPGGRQLQRVAAGVEHHEVLGVERDLSELEAQSDATIKVAGRVRTRLLLRIKTHAHL